MEQQRPSSVPNGLSRREFLRESALAVASLTGTGALLAACTGGKESQRASPGQPVTITVWDYYGSSTPVKPALAGFAKKYPSITVNYQALDWDTINTKFTVTVSSGAAPDVATLDMTWIPTYSSQGLLADLSKLSGGMLNSTPIKDQYAGAGLNAMTYQNNYVTMLFDADCYGLYYRSDLFQQKNIAVPKTWDEFRAAAKQLAEDTNGDGKPDRYLMEIDPDTFHYASYLLQNGGSILDTSNTHAAFNSDAGVAALEMYKGFLDDGSGIYWGPGQGDRIAGLNSGTVAMFEDGPYYMGIMKSGAPKLKGDWRVAISPYSVKPGSYLGGTGLSIPVNAPNPDAGWKLIEYLLEPQQSIGVATYSGALPGLAAAQQSHQIQQPDPYFGGQDTFQAWLPTLASATHYPYVKQWNRIDQIISNSLSSALLGKQTPKEALDSGAAQVNALLSG